MNKFNAKNPLYPLLGFVIAITTLVYGLLMAKHTNLYWFYIALFVLYILIGYYKAFLIVIPMTIFLGGIFTITTYFATKDNELTMIAINRALSVSFMAIPGASISSTLLIRGLNQAKLPKSITLGMMITLNFFPLLKLEMNQIKEAMKTRGVSSILSPKVMYRAFLLPLVVRIVNISETLSVSVETRGFDIKNKTTTIYEPVRMKFKDVFFMVCYIGLMVLTGVYL